MRRILLFASLLALAACHKNETSPPSIDFGAGDGFSYRDATNLPNGTQDATDWTTDATWNAQELALFSGLSFDLNAAQQPNFLTRTAAYPNPGRQAAWQFVRQQTVNPPYSIQVVLVDRHYAAVKTFPAASTTASYYSLSLDYAQLGLQAGSLYRLYYLAYDNNGLLYKGHGDVRYDQ